MRKQRIYAVLLSVITLLACASCADSSKPEGSIAEESSSVRTAKDVIAFRFTADSIQHAEERFLPDYSQLVMEAPEGAVIRYTLDGSVPTEQSETYSEPIVLEQKVGDFPACTVLRAKAFFADGSSSATATQTFWTAFDVNSRYHNMMISVVGDPKEITEAPDGIFVGENAKQRGRESERAVSVEFVGKNGALVLEQDAGLRVFGAASRESSLKSMKLFARKSYDPAHGKFAYDGFGTAGKDGETIDKYDKLVIRNAGNDFQFAFIRDELFQTLAKDAGHAECEAVQPVVVYLNGSYYGLHWLHESICDDLLKDKFGGKEGKYQILEGREREKTVKETDADEAALAEQFNAEYAELSALDLTDEGNYARVNAWLDVPQYLDYFAYNICINNNDWPQGNQKCFRYIAADGENTADNAYLDGKWRFWLHDMDYSAGLYEQDGTAANYNNLAEIVNPDSKRYAPLFTALMQRPDCRDVFRTEVQRLLADTLSKEHVQSVLDEMNTSRFLEMREYFKFLEELKKTDKSIWIWYQGYESQVKMITDFAIRRPGYVQKYLDEVLPPLVTEA